MDTMTGWWKGLSKSSFFAWSSVCVNAYISQIRELLTPSRSGNIYLSSFNHSSTRSAIFLRSEPLRLYPAGTALTAESFAFVRSVPARATTWKRYGYVRKRETKWWQNYQILKISSEVLIFFNSLLDCISVLAFSSHIKAVPSQFRTRLNRRESIFKQCFLRNDFEWFTDDFCKFVVLIHKFDVAG